MTKRIFIGAEVELVAAYSDYAAGERGVITTIERGFNGYEALYTLTMNGVRPAHPQGADGVIYAYRHRFRLVPIVAGQQRKGMGQANAKKRAGSAWLANALAAFKEFCAAEYALDRTETTVDEFRLRGFFGDEPKSPNAWGTLPSAAVRAGYVKPTERVTPARRSEAQARVVRIWEINPAAL